MLPRKHSPLHRFVRTRPHLILAIFLGLIIGPLLPDDWARMTRILTAWNASVWLYLVTMWWMMMRADHHQVKALVARQDERTPVVLFALSVAAVLSLAAIFSQLSVVKNMPSDLRAIHYGLAGITLLGSWFLVGTLFCFHYAHLYYRAPVSERPLQFPDDEANPDYWDFLYFSFTIAVAVQTSDVAVHTRMMRKIVLGQSVLTFFFNLVVLGLSINIAAGLLNT
jgi:uncharacterized membrane protein